MTPTWNVPWPLALIYGLIWALIWMVKLTLILIAAMGIAAYLIGLAGYRLAKRIEVWRRERRRIE